MKKMCKIPYHASFFFEEIKILLVILSVKFFMYIAFNWNFYISYPMQSYQINCITVISICVFHAHDQLQIIFYLYVSAYFLPICITYRFQQIINFINVVNFVIRVMKETEIKKRKGIF